MRKRTEERVGEERERGGWDGGRLQSAREGRVREARERVASGMIETEVEGKSRRPGGGSCAGAALRVRVRPVYNRADAVVLQSRVYRRTDRLAAIRRHGFVQLRVTRDDRNLFGRHPCTGRRNRLRSRGRSRIQDTYLGLRNLFFPQRSTIYYVALYIQYVYVYNCMCAFL